MLTFEDVDAIVDDLRSFFPSEYQEKRFNTKGERDYPYILLNFLEDMQVYFRPLGNIVSFNKDIYGDVRLTVLAIDICTKDLFNTFYTSGYSSGKSEVRHQTGKLTEHISKEWQDLLKADLKHPIKAQNLSGILTATNEYRIQIRVNLIHENYYHKESDIVYAEAFELYLEEDLTKYRVSVEFGE